MNPRQAISFYRCYAPMSRLALLGLQCQTISEHWSNFTAFTRLPPPERQAIGQVSCKACSWTHNWRYLGNAIALTISLFELPRSTSIPRCASYVRQFEVEITYWTVLRYILLFSMPSSFLVGLYLLLRWRRASEPSRKRSSTVRFRITSVATVLVVTVVTVGRYPMSVNIIGTYF